MTRRTSLYEHTYAALDHPQLGPVLIPVYTTMWGRSKYLPHMGLKERIKVLRRMGVMQRIRTVDFLLEGNESD